MNEHPKNDKSCKQTEIEGDRQPKKALTLNHNVRIIKLSSLKIFSSFSCTRLVIFDAQFTHKRKKKNIEMK